MIRPTMPDGGLPMLGLEPDDEHGWVLHAVDPAHIRRKATRALCGRVIHVRPLVEVLSERDLSCEPCRDWWVSETARITRARAGILSTDPPPNDERKP